eukprot:6190029-Pleurochrysis_carterae.AAC.1
MNLLRLVSERAGGARDAVQGAVHNAHGVVHGAVQGAMFGAQGAAQSVMLSRDGSRDAAGPPAPVLHAVIVIQAAFRALATR